MDHRKRGAAELRGSNTKEVHSVTQLPPKGTTLSERRDPLNENPQLKEEESTHLE